MRVLWILSTDPNRPADGQLTYSLSSIEALAAAGAELTVVHLGTRAPARATAAGAHPIQWRPAATANRNRLRSVVSPLPAMAYTAASPEFRRVLDAELAHTWDAVVIDHVQSGWALKVLAGKVSPSTVLVHSSQNDERTVRSRIATGTSGNPAARLVLELDARKVAALEDRILRRVDLVSAITESDAAAFRARRPRLQTVVLPPGYDGTRVAHREITAAVPRRAVVAGSLMWRVKQFDLLSLLEVADARFAAAGAEIVVIGAAPPEFEAEVVRDTKATTMVGRVDSFATAFADARLALVSEPNGGGFKLKTLDYVFHRVPMVVQAGSVTGLPLGHGDGLLEYASVDALVDGALHALDDLETLNRLQNDAYARCEHEFAWTTRGEQLRDAITAAQARKH
jgi:glycosyltransferase involved in cell wall biosynthesis